MRLAKTIALIVASAFLAGISFEFALPTGWCGSCPRRSYTIAGTAGKLGIVEWWPEPHSQNTTWVCIGASHIDVPVSPTWTVMSFVALAASLAGFAPIRRFGLRLIGFAILGTVFTAWAAHFASLSEPLRPQVMLLVAWEPAAATLLLLLLTMTAAIVSWLACFRAGRQFVSPDFAAPKCARAPANRLAT